MLRTKQLGTLTQCARSFYLNGSRCTDGASCTCPDDETSVPQRQTASGIEQKYHSTHRASVKTQLPVQHAVGSVGRSTGYPAPAVHAISSTSTPEKEPASINRGSHPRNHQVLGSDHVQPSKQTPRSISQSGIAGTGVYSDLVNFKSASNNGSTDQAPQMATNYSYQPLSDSRSSNNKAHDQRSFPEAKVPYNPSMKNDFGKGAPRAGYAKPRQSFSGPSVTVSGSPSQIRNTVQQHANYHSNNFNSDARQEDIQTRNLSVLNGFSSSGNKSQVPTGSIKAHGGGPQSNLRSLKSLQAVEQYYHTLQQMKWGPMTEHVLDSLHCKIDAFQANQVLKLIHDHTVALGFFQWLKQQPGFKHDGHTYTTMIGILGQARQFGTLRKLLDEMSRAQCKPTVVTYNRIIHAYGRANYLREAVKVFEEMQEAGYAPDQVTYCTLIDIHAKSGYLEVAMDFYGRMQEVGLSPDTFTYSAMVNCLGKGGQLAAAYKLFCEMIENGCTPNLVTYNIIIALQAKARNYANVVKLYKDMQVAGFRPDKITYSIVMEVLGHCGHLDEAETVFIEMRRDWAPDEPVYGLLVDLWGKAGNVDKALGWYHMMLQDGLQPNVPTCNSLLSAFLKMSRFQDAYSVLQNMLVQGLVPSLQTYTLLLSCCTEAHLQMGLCCQLMAITGHPAHMFLLYLPDAEPGGQNVRDHTRYFLDMMHSEDRESKRGLMDAVINFLHKSGLKEEAGFIWEVAAQNNVYPDSLREKGSSYWLINLHLMSEGTAVTALSRTLAWFHRRILTLGTGPDRIDIVTGWGRRSRVTGSSLVRQSVQKLLNLFEFPFFTTRGNTGCFVGCGEPLNKWLHNPYVERMHLL
ncbi:pentatricopeptide repeat-containing protein At1g18900-like [Phragmites australis]|uniref:pentatricopeptide repeat-containing protein At1g18900-like n=1 Tax=Phragmites australis TaxID=29695 RepID=UPI002D775CB3|nr:pentatricopeptide repeat-containing protein At1g18900-like [Phragmites australis]